jgi:hypothetical protein
MLHVTNTEIGKSSSEVSTRDEGTWEKILELQLARVTSEMNENVLGLQVSMNYREAGGENNMQWHRTALLIPMLRE